MVIVNHGQSNNIFAKKPAFSPKTPASCRQNSFIPITENSVAVEPAKSMSAAQQPDYLIMEQWKVFSYDIPHDRIFNEVVSVNQNISKRNDTLVLADLTSHIRGGLDQTVQRFTDYFKLPLDAASQQPVLCIILEHFTIGKSKYFLTGLPNIFEQFLGLKLHKAPFDFY
jgi:hypothetical protein